MARIAKKLRGHIGFGLCVCVCVRPLRFAYDQESVRDRILKFDIWIISMKNKSTRIFYAPNFEEVEGHIGLGLSVGLSVRACVTLA